MVSDRPARLDESNPRTGVVILLPSRSAGETEHHAPHLLRPAERGAQALSLRGSPVRPMGAPLPGQSRGDLYADGLSLAGVLVAMGNILRLAISGPFEGRGVGLASTTG
jgi:hypothetical protein